MALSPEALAKKNADNAAYKRDKRANSEAFVEKEKVYKKTYANRKYHQAKAAMAFCEAHASAFKKWTRDGIVSASTALQSQRTSTSEPTTNPTAPTEGPLFTPMPDKRLSTYRSLRDGPYGLEIPTAQSLHEAHLGKAGIDRLTEFGIDLR